MRSISTACVLRQLMLVYHHFWKVLEMCILKNFPFMQTPNGFVNYVTKDVWDSSSLINKIQITDPDHWSKSLIQIVQEIKRIRHAVSTAATWVKLWLNRGLLQPWSRFASVTTNALPPTPLILVSYNRAVTIENSAIKVEVPQFSSYGVAALKSSAKLYPDWLPIIILEIFHWDFWVAGIERGLSLIQLTRP